MKPLFVGLIIFAVIVVIVVIVVVVVLLSTKLPVRSDYITDNWSDLLNKQAQGEDGRGCFAFTFQGIAFSGCDDPQWTVTNTLRNVPNIKVPQYPEVSAWVAYAYFGPGAPPPEIPKFIVTVGNNIPDPTVWDAVEEFETVNALTAPLQPADPAGWPLQVTFSDSVIGDRIVMTLWHRDGSVGSPGNAMLILPEGQLAPAVAPPLWVDTGARWLMYSVP